MTIVTLSSVLWNLTCWNERWYFHYNSEKCGSELLIWQVLVNWTIFGSLLRWGIAAPLGNHRVYFCRIVQICILAWTGRVLSLHKSMSSLHHKLYDINIPDPAPQSELMLLNFALIRICSSECCISDIVTDFTLLWYIFDIFREK